MSGAYPGSTPTPYKHAAIQVAVVGQETQITIAVNPDNTAGPFILRPIICDVSIVIVNVIWTAGGRCGKMWEALVNGLYKTFDLGYATVEAVEAGHSPSHGAGSAV